MIILRIRLSILYFLQFAVWGCYLTCLGQLLGAAGLGSSIAWFYAAIGLVSLLTPAFIGHIADRICRPHKILRLCHGGAALVMLIAWAYSFTHPVMEFGIFFPLYFLFLALYLPTMALANTTAFGILKSRGMQPVDAFPAIRVWGTVGFVAAMWFVNSAYWADGHFGFTLSDHHSFSRFRFQYTSMQLLAASLFGFLTALYTLCLPTAGSPSSPETPTSARPGLLNSGAIHYFFRRPYLRMFLIFIALSGVCLQISNGFATPFITHFTGLEEYAGSLAAGNATMLFSLSQIAEALCILLVGVSLKRFGIRVVITLGLSAWGLRFLLFALGNTGDGLWLLILSMLVYGVAFNFLTIAGHLYMEQESPRTEKGLGQGVMMLMSNGVGATLGILIAGRVINHWCSWQVVTTPAGPVRLFMGDWLWPWLVFALYAFCLAAVFFFVFRPSAKFVN
ncbi:MAG: nucleoside permease [Bacteroides sp.]|nr:nucleoside permease [Bacteroides sp.]